MEALFLILQQFFSDTENLKILSIPVISALSGWITNWIAIKLTLYPIEFVGIRPIFGWQGILPAKSKKIARILMDKTISHLGSLREIMEEMEPEKISQYMHRELSKNIEIYVDEAMEEVMPVAWVNTPLILKKRIYKRVIKQTPELAKDLIGDIGENIDQLLDLEEMVVDQLTEDPALLVRIFKEIGDKEMRFGVNSGFFFGLLFGCMQMVSWSYYSEAWVLPFFGVIVGTATNWIVINIIFRPLNPITIFPGLKLGPFTIKPIILQGLFLKRQSAVAKVFSRILTTELLTISRFMDTIFNGPKGDIARKLIKRRVKPYIESGLSKVLIQSAVGFERYLEIKNELQNKAIFLSLQTLDDPVFNAERGVVVANSFESKINAMPPSDFQDMLRPAFEEDEWIILLMGGVLGGLVGLGQFTLLFA